MKRFMLSFVMLAISAMSLFAMGGKEAPPTELEAVTIRVGALKGPTGIGMIHLFDATPILPQKASLSVEAVAATDVMTAKLMSGELDAAVLPINMAAKLYAAGLPYRLVAVVGSGMVKILSSDASVKSIQDLCNKDVYVAGQGATPDYLLRTILAKAGIKADTDVRLIYSMPIPEIAASMVAGRISIAVVPEPFATLASSGNLAVTEPFSLTALWKDATGQDDYPMSAFVVRDTLITQRPLAVKAILDAYRSSIERVQADPSAAGVLVEKYDMGLKAAVAAKAIPRSAYVFIPAIKARSAVEQLLSVFLSFAPASIGGKLPEPSFYAEF